MQDIDFTGVDTVSTTELAGEVLGEIIVETSGG
jgi:hypothetical protein